MNKRNICLIALLVIGTGSPLSHAGHYLTGSVGVFGYGKNNFIKNLVNNHDELGFSSRIAVGYLWQKFSTISVGPEVGFTHYNRVTLKNQANLSTKRVGMDVLGVAEFRIYHQCNFFAKAGVGYDFQKYFPTNNENMNAFTNDKFVIKAILGMEYEINSSLSTQVGISHTFARNQNSNSIGVYMPAATAMMVGAAFRF